jgi:hypothetical protein
MKSTRSSKFHYIAAFVFGAATAVLIAVPARSADLPAPAAQSSPFHGALQ